MRIVEHRVTAGDREIFDLAEFLSRPLYAHLAHDSGRGPRESPVWFHWDGQALWIIGGTSFPENLRREPRCAIGIVDWNPASGLSQHVGLRGRAEMLAFDPAVARTILGKYFGSDEDRWDPRFREDIDGETGVPLIRFVPETVVMRDQSYKPPRGASPRRRAIAQESQAAISRRKAPWRLVCFRNSSRGSPGQVDAERLIRGARPLIQGDQDSPTTSKHGKAAGSDRRRQKHFGGIMNTKRAIATLIGPALSAFLGTWHELEAGGPAGSAPLEQAQPVDREAWARKLAALNEADWRTAFATVEELAALPDDEGFAILKANWEKISKVEARQQLLKAWDFAMPYPLHLGDHPRLLDGLDLGMRDPSPEVQKWAIDYLGDIALQDFSEDFPAYKAWYQANRDKPVPEVIAGSARRFAAEAARSVKKRRARSGHDWLAEHAKVFRQVPEVREAALDAGLMRTRSSAGRRVRRPGRTTEEIQLAVNALNVIGQLKPERPSCGAWWCRCSPRRSRPRCGPRRSARSRARKMPGPSISCSTCSRKAWRKTGATCGRPSGRRPARSRASTTPGSSRP